MSNFTPAWFKKSFFNESLFCDDFLSTHQLLYSNGAFFTPDGRMVDPMPLRCEIFKMMREYVGANLAKKVTNVVDVLKLAAQVEDFPPVTDRIALANGTLYLDGTFQEGKPEIVRNRLPVRYDPKAPQPTHWLRFLSDLLYPEDIPTVQEFIGYCLIPSNKGQRMMIIKGNGGEGKSQIGVVLSRLFGCNMKDGSIGKISENRFARADLEHTLLCVDDDMRMEALRQTNYVKSIVTAQGQMDLERKGKQSYQSASPLLSDLHAKIAAVIAAPQRHASLPDQLRMQPGIADVVAVAKAATQFRAAVFCAGVVIGALHHIHTPDAVAGLQLFWGKARRRAENTPGRFDKNAGDEAVKPRYVQQGGKLFVARSRQPLHIAVHGLQRLLFRHDPLQGFVGRNAR